MTPEQTTALAEACERAADELGEVEPCAGRCEAYDERLEAIKLLRAHARALRAGRVTITEEATNG